MKMESMVFSQCRRMIMVMLLAALGMAATACEKEEGDVIINTAIELRFTDAIGHNLLDPATPNAFSQEEIELYYLVNGERKLTLDGSLDYPKHFFVFQAGTQHIMRLFPSLHEENMRTQTYIRLSETDTDTISCAIKRWGKGNQSAAVTKVWYNNELVWEGTGPRYVEVVK
ncbi:hypothetical protein [Pontibacter indicus]|nr:hypothetical protein [Pontibacter indicus]